MAFAGFFARGVVSWVLAPALAIVLLKLTPDRLGLIVGAGTFVKLAILPLNARLISTAGAAVALLVSLGAVIAGLVVVALVQ
ncbi:hypothetical protein KC217_21955, partial [Mycobacterium tuberculosis]|nr:hypothetical protein [Mycobacterium tuberculosis]